MQEKSPLHKTRQQYQPRQPKLLGSLTHLGIQKGEATSSACDVAELRRLFPQTFGQSILSFSEGEPIVLRPLRVGVVLSGGQAAGGHNVIAGIYDAVKELHSESQIYGFLDGPAGIVKAQYVELTGEIIDEYRNQGGFDMIGSGRTKIETSEQFRQAEETVRGLSLDGLVIIGGDDSNTNAALLAENFLQRACPTTVVGVPKTIDGDLKNEHVEISFGFDTACKTYSEILGNLARDALSAKKYYFFVKLMGRSASHIALECALQTHPNAVLIGEEVAAKRQTLAEVTNGLCDMICARAEAGKNYGLVLIPEGIIEFIPEVRVLIQELNELLSPEQKHSREIEVIQDVKEQVAHVVRLLSPESARLLQSLPAVIQEQLLLDRDPHGNVQVSKIETERLLIQTVQAELRRRQVTNEYKGKFSPQALFCGYEGRSCLPSNFDAQYTYALGKVASLLIHHGATGYMAAVKNLTKAVEEWTLAGLPITMMLNLEERHGTVKPVIRKALVDLEGAPYRTLEEQRGHWGTQDDYRYPGPIQFFGDTELTELPTITLQLESKIEALRV